MAAVPEGKRRINTLLDAGAYDGLHEFVRRNGTNMTAFLDAFGSAVADLDRPPRWLEPVLEEARGIAGQRSSRKPAPPPT